MVLQSVSAGQTAAGQSKVAVDFAIAALRGGDGREAERLLREALLRDPRNAEILDKLAELAIADRRMEEATILLRRTADAEPTLERCLAIVRHLHEFAGAPAALDELEGFPAEFQATFLGRAKEAELRGILGQHDRQIAIYEGMAVEEPDNPLLWMSLGNALKTFGRTEEAIAAVRRAIALRPTYGEGYWTLANFKSYRFGDRDLSAMRAALKKKLNDEDALHFHFALGKALEDRNFYQQSFQHYAEGNRIRASSLTPEQMYMPRFVDVATGTFTPELFERYRGVGSKEAGPIFVLGLHRSGSTLVEQILASHPMIEGTTEITIMQQIWDRIGRMAKRSGRNVFQEIAQLDSGAFAEIGAEYLERTRAFRLTDKPYFVDKLPSNWLNLGLILLALPNARIIDARRHPMACGFSNFKQHYGAGVHFSYSLDSIGRFYRDYWRFMNHIDRVLPGRVHRVINERLIDDPEGEVRRMLEFVGVDFDPACLEFHRNPRSVRTPSAEQVRRPINREGVDYWKHYEPWLDPLKQALGDALNNWDKPAA